LASPPQAPASGSWEWGVGNRKEKREVRKESNSLTAKDFGVKSLFSRSYFLFSERG